MGLHGWWSVARIEPDLRLCRAKDWYLGEYGRAAFVIVCGNMVGRLFDHHFQSTQDQKSGSRASC